METGADACASVGLIQPGKLFYADLDSGDLSVFPHTHMAKSFSL